MGGRIHGGCTVLPNAAVCVQDEPCPRAGLPEGWVRSEGVLQGEESPEPGVDHLAQMPRIGAPNIALETASHAPCV